MFSNRYFVDRSHDTYSDITTVFGLAYVLRRALRDAGLPEDVTIRDLGTVFTVNLAAPLSEEAVTQAEYPTELLPFIQDELHPEGAEHYPLQSYLSQLGSKTAGAAAQADAEIAAQQELPDDLGAMRAIRSHQAEGIWNGLAEQLWAHRAHYKDFLKVLLDIYATTPNRLNEGQTLFRAWKRAQKSTFKDQYSMLAIINPTAQKSVNRAKPDGVPEVNQDNFWISEWLKMIGMPHCIIVMSVEPVANKKFEYNKEDRKVYALAPKNLDLNTHQRVLDQFRPGLFRASSIKADIEIVFKYIEAFFLYLESTGRKVKFGRMPDVVDGFYCAYFKKSGSQASAFSLTALPYLRLPDWISFIDVPTVEEISIYRAIIEDHRRVLFFRFSDGGKYVNFIEENRGEGHALLRDYRDFLSSGDTDALLSFLSSFPSLLMQQAGRSKDDKTYRQFTASTLKELLLKMEQDHPRQSKLSLQEIMEDDGFREVARAIRLCTVTAQRFKSKGIKWHHEIRYGLAQELKRRAPFKDEFTAVLMEFTNNYQTENARHRERGGSNIHEITTTHIQRLTMLLDRCESGAEPVASLLIAFGYAYDDSREESDEDKQTADTVPLAVPTA